MDIDMDPVAGDEGQQPQPGTDASLHMPPEDGRKQLDLVFVQDCTGSQGSYISSATRNIEEICAAIFESGKLLYQEDLRIGLVAYRDHPPQDHTYVTKNFGFSSDTKRVHDHLKSLYASGGGDGPEAVTAALYEAVNMDWRPHASKMVVLIADAPPHGIGEYGDGFDEGSPDGHDPLIIARQMAARGITLFFVACEPALSGYSYATDFFQALTSITSGLMLPLTTANLLAHAIIGSVLENLDMERLIREVGQAVAERILGGQESVDDVARELHEKLLLRNESTKKVVFENIYRESDEAKHNVSVFQNAPNLNAARPLLKKVKGTRFTDKYLAVRHSVRSEYSSYRKPVSPSIPVAPTPSSPAHKVVTDFPTFSAPSASVFGAAVAPGPFSVAGSRTAFGAMRGGRGDAAMDDDEEEAGGGADEEDVVEGIQLREDSITLDQAKRIALQSAWRGTRGA
ncbi:elongation factor-2 kinase [Auriculariales sp. MPI-PUGE-AT-0066]|nr:elongation factor-2 kinase [Auriculariales sp. MPI-PUGE-AT-0066]